MKSNTRRLGIPDLRMSWFCSFVCCHWQELVEWIRGCRVSDHAIATLLFVQLQEAPVLGFQAFCTIWPLDFVTQTIFFQKYLFFCMLLIHWIVSVTFLLSSIRRVWVSSALLHRFLCCSVNCSQQGEFCYGEWGEHLILLGLSLTSPFPLWIALYWLPWSMLMI